MQVEDGLAGLRAPVGDQAVSRLLDPLPGGQLVGHGEYPADQAVVFGADTRRWSRDARWAR